MAAFKDFGGKEWNLTIDLVEIRRVREATGVHLGKLAEVWDLAEDILKFGDVIWAMCEEQAQKDKTTQEQFLRRLTKDALPRAHDALVEAYLFFSPSAEEALIRKLIEEMKQKRISTLNGSAGSSVGSAELIPTGPA